MADDDLAVLELTSRMLAQAGYEVITASNGHDAEVTFSERKDDISVVILDMVMPVMDGAEAARKIRAIAEDVAILFVSGYVPSSSESLGDPLLRKPFKMDKLLEMVRRLASVPRPF